MIARSYKMVVLNNYKNWYNDSYGIKISWYYMHNIYTMCPNYLKSFIKFCSEFLSLYIKEKNKVLGTEVFLLKYNYV